MSTGAPSYPHLKSHRAKRGPRWPGPGRNPGPRDDSEGRPQPRYRPLAHPPREIRSLPTAGKYPQPTLAEERTHRDTAHACSTCSAPRSVRLTCRPDPLSLALFVSPSRSFCRSLLPPSLSLSPVRETVLPSPVTCLLSSTHRCALFTRHPALLCNFADTTAQWRNARGEKRRKKARAQGQIAIALYHSRSRTASARNEGSGDDYCQHRSPDPLCASPAVQYNTHHHYTQGR